MSGVLVSVLRVFLVVLFLGCAAAQVFSGGLAARVVGGVAGTVMTVLIVAGLFCVEGVLVGVWMLAGMVHDDAIFDGRAQADRWVNVAISALGVGAVIATAGLVYFLVDEVMSGPTAGSGMTIVAAAAAVVAWALALVVTVMRRLLHTAIQYQSDLAEVI